MIFSSHNKINVTCDGANQEVDEDDVENALRLLTTEGTGRNGAADASAARTVVLLMQLEIGCKMMLLLMQRLQELDAANQQLDDGRKVGYPVAFKPSPLDSTKVDEACQLLDAGVRRLRPEGASLCPAALPAA